MLKFCKFRRRMMYHIASHPVSILRHAASLGLAAYKAVVGRAGSGNGKPNDTVTCAMNTDEQSKSMETFSDEPDGLGFVAVLQASPRRRRLRILRRLCLPLSSNIRLEIKTP